MTNVFDELEEFFNATELTWNDVVAAEILLNKIYDKEDEGKASVRLKRNYTQDDLELFLSQLIKMNYEKVSFDEIELLGTIWLTNGTWLNRIQDQYFQEERWCLYEYPEFPEYL